MAIKDVAVRGRQPHFVSPPAERRMFPLTDMLVKIDWYGGTVWDTLIQ